MPTESLPRLKGEKNPSAKVELPNNLKLKEQKSSTIWLVMKMFAYAVATVASLGLYSLPKNHLKELKIELWNKTKQPSTSSLASMLGNKEGNDACQVLRKKVFEVFRIPATNLHRKYPEVAVADTIQVINTTQLPEKQKLLDEMEDNLSFQKSFPELLNLSPFGAHGYGNSYQDQDILYVHEIINTEIKEGLSVDFTKNNKPIIQQQATRGCTAGAVTMLIYSKDNSGPIDVRDLQMRNLSTDETMIEDITQAGLQPLESECNTIPELRSLLQKHGSAIVTVNSGVGSHVVVVDEILNDRVRLRDPYHGWEVDIKIDAFKNSWCKGSIIQV